MKQHHSKQRLDQEINLLRSHARETEHANLLCDMVPLVGTAQSFQALLQGGPHSDDAICHALHLLHRDSVPLLMLDQILPASNVDWSRALTVGHRTMGF